MTYTTYYSLLKPGLTDLVNIGNINTNMDTLDSTIHAHVILAATTSAIGHVKPDGTIITVDVNGAITVPIATTSIKGVVKPDGTTITIDGNGVITGTSTTPIATTTVAGKVMPDGTVITVDGAGHITVPIATTSIKGVVKPDGTTITVDVNGVISSTGGGGSGTLITSLQTYTSTTVTATIPINIATYLKTTDTLLVFVNSVFLQYNVDYTVDSGSANIVKSSGTWDSGTIFNFVCLENLATDPTATLSVVRLASSFTASSNGTTNCLINQAQYVPATDILEVYYDNTQMYITDNYTLNGSTSIDLVGWSLNTGEKLVFYVWKNVKTSVATVDFTQLSPELQTAIQLSYFSL